MWRRLVNPLQGRLEGDGKHVFKAFPNKFHPVLLNPRNMGWVGWAQAAALGGGQRIYEGLEK